jgi:HAD superfamily hydrolase (TIGR01509 family)
MQNKLVIFDLDGVLLDSRDLHYYALNKALKEVCNTDIYHISRDEHLSKYDGLSTTKKLKMLTEYKGLSPSLYDSVWKAKQKATFDLIPDAPQNKDIFYIVKQLKSKGWKVAVASNSIRDTVRIALTSLKLIDMVDYYVSNEDVKRSKPFPEMYWDCMIKLNALPKNTIIVEDSHIGREAALNSGSNLYAVKDAYELNGNKFMHMIDEFERKDRDHNVPWRDNKLNVVIPMAGAGSRFATAGYTFPKPLIEVRGKPMIQVVIENLNIEANYIFLVQKSHYEKYNLQYLLNLICPGCSIVQIDGLTEGAACSVLTAKELINNDKHLLMVNSDQCIEWNSNEIMYGLTNDSIDGGILTFKSTHPKYSYVNINEDGFVKEVVEKKVISNLATVGMYYWSKGSDFVKYAEKMIDDNKRINNEFYVAPVYQEAIDDGKKFKIKNIESFWSLGTPEDLNRYLAEYPK